MGRPHTEFIQTETLPWACVPADAARAGVRERALSHDAETGAASTMLLYPAGWRDEAAHALDCDEELFVLDGALRINAVDYGPGDYAYLPAGFRRAAMSSPSGATVLTFFESAPRRVAPDARCDARRLIEKVASNAMPWGDPGDPVVAAAANGAGLKVLREDPETMERTWLLRFGPDDPSRTTHGRVERHPVVEEFFLLDGEISMTCGVLTPGAYFWRPPMIEHGPVGTRKGLTAFFRCKGGPLTTLWSQDALPIVWEAPYRPTLPPELAARAGVRS